MKLQVLIAISMPVFVMYILFYNLIPAYSFYVKIYFINHEVVCPRDVLGFSFLVQNIIKILIKPYR